MILLKQVQILTIFRFIYEPSNLNFIGKSEPLHAESESVTACLRLLEVLTLLRRPVLNLLLLEVGIIRASSLHATEKAKVSCRLRLLLLLLNCLTLQVLRHHLWVRGLRSSKRLMRVLCNNLLLAAYKWLLGRPLMARSLRADQFPVPLARYKG